MIGLRVQAGALFGSLVFGALFFLLYDLFNRLFYHYQGSFIRLPFELSLFSLFGFSYYLFLANVTDGIYNIFYFLFLFLGVFLYYKFYHIYFLSLFERFYLFLRLKILRTIARRFRRHYRRFRRYLGRKKAKRKEKKAKRRELWYLAKKKKLKKNKGELKAN